MLSSAPAAGMAPVAGERGQADDGPHGHAAAAVALEAVVDADERRTAERPCERAYSRAKRSISRRRGR